MKIPTHLSFQITPLISVSGVFIANRAPCPTTFRSTKPAFRHLQISPRMCSSPPSAGGDDGDENAYIFQPSKLAAARRRRAGPGSSPGPNEARHTAEPQKPQKGTEEEGSGLSFETHAQLMDALLALSGDPLEADGGRVVTFRGSVDAKLMIIGEAPGEQEDIVGQPFVGKAGQLLDNIFRYAGFDLQNQIYVSNIVRRRPPNNRTPTQKEINFYLPYLLEEMRLVKPSIVILAGSVPTRALLDKNTPITSARGRWFHDHHHIPWTMPVFHPSFLLRKPSMKKEMLVDIHAIRDKYIELFPNDSLNDLTPITSS